LGKIANPSAQSSLENSPQVNIDADAKAPHQAVMRALEAARDANLPNVVFSSQGTK
jgi:biopolymer transport protein ExbD